MIGRKHKSVVCSRATLLGAFILCCSPPLFAQPTEEQVGEVSTAKILGVAPLVNSEPAQKYLNLVGTTLTEQTSAKYNWRFGLVKTDSVNAFAAPGGFVLVTEGLVKQLKNEDELAFVLAHEIAHVVQRHHYKVILRQQLAETAAKNVQQASGDTLKNELSQASAQIYARGLDKGSEFEADRIGVELMAQAGYDPAASISVLERLQALRGNDPRLELLFSTHPSPAVRLDMLLKAGLDGLIRPKETAVSHRGNRYSRAMSGLQ